ncbi:MAG TPA: ribose-phosphate pyrophosphokinase [Candidatus Limivivens intestinipullorum]|uniref:ribose-phosphate diphosphokinase n=1 Tax=Candidatus Limivivens intestinipullorum TaxID=2840858 RepID=A0A9D1ER57_9FIRM|nr:ribose-phosphate pyrophosphokinase [Candidatus Limivivens intestinipullorum]
MPNFEPLQKAIPLAPLKLAALEGSLDFAEKVNAHLVDYRHLNPTHEAGSIAYKGYAADTYLLKCACPRFGTGEAKGIIGESVRGTDMFIMVDVCNFSLTYTVCGHKNHMSPDDHYQDLKRIISAANGKARRINVIMPFLYEGRQHKRTKRESLDCALALQELVDMGVSNIVTFDAHDPRVQNSIPLQGFDSYMPTYQFLKALIQSVPDFRIDNDHLMIISPDEGAMSRAVYFSNILGVDMGMFYKRRDYSTIVNGKNPIVAHEFLGDSVEGKDVIIIDDMISSGESMLDVAKQLKERKAARVFVCTTFGLFTDGLAKFDEYYEKGYITKVVTTNLNYRLPELLTKPYYQEADMTKFLASIIDSMNHNVSINHVLSPTEKIHKLLDQYHQR